MKLILITIVLLALFFSANAQKHDTTIYECYRLKTDTEVRKGDCPEELLFDAMPEFPGGEKRYMEFLKTSVHYPVDTKDIQSHGRVIMSVVIEKNGRVTNAKIVRGVSKKYDKDAIRVIESSPKWKPAIYNGKRVRVLRWVVIGYPPNA